MTAVAAESSPGGVRFWVASAHEKSAALIQETLQRLSKLFSASEDDRNAVIGITATQAVQSSRDIIKAYITFLHLNSTAATSEPLLGVEEGMWRDLQLREIAVQKSNCVVGHSDYYESDIYGA